MGLFKKAVSKVADKIEVGKDERENQKNVGSVEDALKKAAKKKPDGAS